MEVVYRGEVEAIVAAVAAECIAEGRHQGRREELLASIELALELKFGDSGIELARTISVDEDDLSDLFILHELRDAIRSAQTVDDVRRAVETAFEDEPPGMALAEQWRQQGREEGRREELLAGIELALELKFGDSGPTLMPEVRQIEDLATLRAVRDAMRGARTVADLRRVYALPAAPGAAASDQL